MRIVPIEVHCWKCDYSLRGLDPKGRCPECGQFISKSVAKHRLGKRRNPLRSYLLLLGLAAAYPVVNIVFVYLMMEVDPFLIFHVWQFLAIVAPVLVILSSVIWYFFTRRVHWVAILCFVFWLMFIGWLNFVFMAACSASV